VLAPSYASITYPSSYLRFSGALLNLDMPLSLPQIESQQSYGIDIFHGAAGAHVVLVQTGGGRAACATGSLPAEGQAVRWLPDVAGRCSCGGRRLRVTRDDAIVPAPGRGGIDRGELRQTGT
jgi:hypothetical protein